MVLVLLARLEISVWRCTVVDEGKSSFGFVVQERRGCWLGKKVIFLLLVKRENTVLLARKEIDVGVVGKEIKWCW